MKAIADCTLLVSIFPWAESSDRREISFAVAIRGEVSYGSKKIVYDILVLNAALRIPIYIDDLNCYEYDRYGDVYTEPGELAGLKAAAEFHIWKIPPVSE